MNKLTTESAPFKNPEISRAVEFMKPKIKSFTANLDIVSQDIKAVEQWLQKSGFCYSCSMTLSSEGWTEKYNALSSRFERQPTRNGAISEYLRWEKDLMGKSWRLMYAKKQFKGKDDLGKEIECRPLIECSADIRINAHNELPNLLNAIERSKALNVKRFDLAPIKQ